MKFVATASISLLLFFGTSAVQAQRSPINRNGGAYAIDGYDPVAYFIEGRAVRGTQEFSFEYLGSTFLFASAEHRERFESRPSRYAPQYGGYCAYAMAKGQFVTVDPQAFTVHGGKLYLNYSRTIQEKWLEHRDEYIQSANQNWARLRPR
ncbi:MAG: YHS domain-containing (seleno)protein [Myxococcota bacterium]